MTYFEELGVPEDAPAEAIRRAYRQISRLLHPDLQSSPELRRAAEMQMRRLNEVVEILCNPADRARYDHSLGAANPRLPVVPHPPIEVAPTPLNFPVWIAGAIFGGLIVYCLCLILFTVPSATPPPSSLPSAPRSSAPNSPANAARAFTPSARSATVIRRPAAPAIPAAALADPEPAPIPPLSTTGESLSPLLLTPDHPHLATPPPPPALAASSPPSKLTGVWLALRESPASLAPGEYASEFVELRLQQDGRQIRGDFRSRYRVSDRISNPQVSFAFAGKVEDQEFPWSGPAGSKGSVRLDLTTSGVLKLEWVAEILPPGSQLRAGSANLIRRRDD
jgi:curved DNA-binding protein CbpA